MLNFTKQSDLKIEVIKNVNKKKYRKARVIFDTENSL